MTEENKAKTPMNAVQRVALALIIAVAVVLLFWGGNILAYAAGLSYRMWVQALGGIVAFMIVPFLLLLLIGVFLFQRFHLPVIIKVLLPIAEAGVYLICLSFDVLVMAFGISDEKKLFQDYVLVNEGFPESWYVCYEKVGPLFRRQCELPSEVKADYLQEKYNRAFGVSEDGTIYDKEHPEIEPAVYLVSASLDDNYVTVLTEKLVQDGCTELGLERYLSVSGIPQLVLYGEEDIEAFSRDAAELLQYIEGKTVFFEEYRGALQFTCEASEGAWRGTLPFGKLSQYDEMEADYYLDPEQVEEVVHTIYAKEKKNLEQMNEWQAEYELKQEERLETENAVNAELAEKQKVKEESARKVYDAVLAKEGYSYEVCYDAKGNLYLNLGSRPAGEKEDLSTSGTYRFSLVYDRTSKNEACELFVLYKEHYTEDGMNDGTAILDMYAVETSTGTVIAADKQGWSDAASEAYLQATGE